jgi:D-beta-D-heptose 7-phosphate kinase/D-beta-D-heptose 1-phosphate adenosyltransferase
MNVAPAPILTVDEAVELAAGQRAAGRVVVMTHGVFDLMHPGHIRFLEGARAEGDLLIVAVSSDRIVRENKGPARPILPEAERAELLAALAPVDAVVISDDPTPAAVIQRIQPDVLVQGGEGPEAHNSGGRVVRLNAVSGYSTSALIDKVNASQ